MQAVFAPDRAARPRSEWGQSQQGKGGIWNNRFAGKKGNKTYLDQPHWFLGTAGMRRPVSDLESEDCGS